MEERMILSGDNALRELRPGSGRVSSCIELAGAGALAAFGEELYVASEFGNVIWRLRSQGMIPVGLFAGGPGICQMMLSRDGNRLCALCSEADSILMLCAKTGAPMVINRAGVAPCAMALDDTGKSILVAGGASGEVLRFDEQTLRLTQRFDTPGMVFSVLAAGKEIYALSLDETMNSVLTIFSASGKHCVSLAGMPGTLCRLDGRVAAATHEGIYVIDAERKQVCRCCRSSGRAGRLFENRHGLWMTDLWGENLMFYGGGGWRVAAKRVRDVLMLPETG